MNELVVITDCDFGDGTTEAKTLSSRGFDLRKESARTEEQVIHAAAGAVGLMVQYAPITARVMRALPDLRAVVRYGVGTDTIDVRSAKELGIGVRGVHDYCTAEVADHTLALMLACVRSVACADEAVKRGEWPTPNQLPLLTTLTGKTVGLIGFGRIAQAVAVRLKGFECRIIAYDPYIGDDVIRGLDVEPASFEQTLKADIISLHAPAQQDGKPLISESTIRAMHPSSIVVNVSRGSLVDEGALVSALSQGRVAAAGLDVLAEERPGQGPLACLPQATITPHIAYYSARSLDLLRIRAAETLADLLEGNLT